MRDPDAWAVMPGEPDCAVLDVPQWWWDAVSLGALIERGGVNASEIDAAAWTEAEIAWSVLQSRREAQREIQRKKAEMLRGASR